ncbi:MAG TPA: hypothetical protein VEU95_14930 [Micropepsaceae bacterium]|nr:hypothetical protein [Micropepsaceae bacterium]
MLEGRILVSAIMLIAFAAAVGLAFTYAPEARFLPLVIGIPGLLFSIIQLIKELRERPEPVVTSEEQRREGRMFAWAVLYGVFELFLGLPLFEGLVFQWIFG